MSVISVPLSRTRPGQSIPVPSDRTGGSCGISRFTSRVDPMTASVGSANIQCRESPSATGPADSVPAIPPATNSPLTTPPMATFDSPSGRCARTRMNDSGSAPTIAPCSNWPSSSTGRFGASDDTIPPTPTTAISRTRTRFPPYRSPNLPATGVTSAPVMSSMMPSNAPSAGLMSSSRCRSGSVGVTTDSRARRGDCQQAEGCDSGLADADRGSRRRGHGGPSVGAGRVVGGGIRRRRLDTSSGPPGAWSRKSDGEGRPTWAQPRRAGRCADAVRRSSARRDPRTTLHGAV